MIKVFESIKEEVDRAKHIVVCAHVSPDPDAVGSTMALGTMLEDLGKRVYFFIPGFSEDRYRGIPEVHKIQSRLPQSKTDLIFALDYGKMQRLEIDEILEKDKPVLVSIDHHPPQDQQGRIVWVDPEKSSVAEMIYNLARALEWPIKEKSAFYILFGIIGDTVGLSTPSVTPELLKVVIDLMEHGASLEKAQTIRHEVSSLEQVKISAQALLRTEFYPDEKLAVTWVPMEDWRASGVDPSSFTGLANELKWVRGVMVSLVLIEQDNKWYGHLRGRAESKADLGKVAEALGGGGHRNASGFTSTLSREDIIRKVCSLLKA